MKILVCMDGSIESQKALEEAAIIARGCNVAEVTVIHVYKAVLDSTFPFTREGITQDQMKSFKNIMGVRKENKKNILAEAERYLKEKDIKTQTILKEGHPAESIVNLAKKEGFDMIVLGNRGLGGLQKVFLGSVSNAIIQQAENCSVLVVK